MLPSRKQLARIARMAVLGEFTGGIAHHTRNNLAVILGNLQLLAEGDHAFLDGKVGQMVNDALFAAEKNTGLARELSELSASASDNETQTDINEVVRSFSDLARIALGRDAVVHVRLADRALPISMNRRDLAACLLFLLSNARVAMPTGGSLLIATNLSDEGERATLEVKDSGRGMTPEVLARATELFYTHRDSGEAGGLGLSVTRDLVESANGRLDIKSAPGKGTTVSIVMPLLS
jgi:signal transduction histidine kinase